MLERFLTQTGETSLSGETVPEQQDLIDHVTKITGAHSSCATPMHQDLRDGSPAEAVTEGDVFIPAPPAEASADRISPPIHLQRLKS